MKADEILVLAGNFRVAAFSKANGEQIWETVLMTGFFKMGGPFVTLAVDETGIYAHVSNELFRLDLATGKILWQKKITTLGRDVASLALLGDKVASTTSAFARVNLDRQRNSSGDTAAS